MGFFSSLMRAFMDVIKSIVKVVGEFLGSIFGNNPIVMAIVMFAVVWFCSPLAAGLTEAWTASLALSSGSITLAAMEMIAAYPIVFGSMLNVVLTVLGEVVPPLKRATAFLSGLVTFITFTYGGWVLYQAPELLLSPGVLRDVIAGGLSSMVGSWWPVVSAYFLFNATSGIVDSDYVEGFYSGFSAIPVAVADAADAVVGTVTSSLLPILVGAAALYWFAKRPNTVEVEYGEGYNSRLLSAR